MKAGSSCGWVPKSPASTAGAAVGDWKPRQATSMRDRSWSPTVTSTHRGFPNGPGRSTGEVLHSSAYRNPGRIRARACWLLAPGRPGWRSPTTSPRAARPKSGWRCARRRTSCCGRFPVACRAIWSPSRYTTPPSVSPTRSAGRRAASNLGDLSEFGLPIPEEGVFSRRQTSRSGARRWSTWMSSTPSGMGRSRWSPTVESFDGDKVVLVDGSRLDAHAVVLATGYRTWSGTAGRPPRRARRGG